jgi:predicted RNase H-like nuclease (RuvC/YqgF family)
MRDEFIAGIYNELKIERERLEKAMKYIDKEMGELEAKIDDLKRYILSEKGHIYDTMNKYEADEMIRNIFSEDADTYEELEAGLQEAVDHYEWMDMVGYVVKLLLEASIQKNNLPYPLQNGGVSADAENTQSASVQTTAPKIPPTPLYERGESLAGDEDE